MTLREYRLLPEDVLRHELLQGVLVREPAPTPKHQTLSRRLQFQLMAQLEVTGIADVFDAPIDVIIDERNVVQPDLVIVSRARSSIITERAIEGTPDVVVEILSKSTRSRDRRLKRQLYERFGVPEYWVVDPSRESVEAHALGASGYALRELYTRESILRCPLFPSLAVFLHAVFPQAQP